RGALGDLNQDGTLDIVVANRELDEENYLYFNYARASTSQGGNNPQISVIRPTQTGNAYYFSTSEVLADSIIPIQFTLSDVEGDNVGWIKAYYSLNGGGVWHEAIATNNTETRNLKTSSQGIPYTFYWDTFASGLFGFSDNLVFRMEAYPNTNFTGIIHSYRYTNTVPARSISPYASSTTAPFSVRGTQVRVVSEEDEPATEAAVYQLSSHNPVGQPIANNQNHPFVTNPDGYLQGHGQMALNDALVALLPVKASELLSFTTSISAYYTSAVPTESGISAHTISQSGVQTLTVSEKNKLLLFHLTVSLEWDARNTPNYLEQLEQDLHRASEILYDLTNGQAALGTITVYQNKQDWQSTNIVIYAANNVRPSANLGGIVEYGVNDRLQNSTVVTNAFIPGQIRMGAIWNRFGETNGEVGEDWPRTLAHELGHYLFFLLDNYLGLSDDNLLIETDCQGSAMTDPYQDASSEFLTGDEWTGQCTQTLAEKSTGRNDWETVKKFYPFLNADLDLDGPNRLPLAVTKVDIIPLEGSSDTLNAPFFTLVGPSGEPLRLENGQAHGYLLKTQNTPDPVDDVLIPLGTNNLDLMHSRGAAPGDRLCVFNYDLRPMQLGCTTISSTSSPVKLQTVDDWPPTITVTPVNSRTFTISATHTITEPLHLQILPANGVASDVTDMVWTGAYFSQTIVLTEPTFTGHAYLWVDGSQPRKEILSQFSLSHGWQANSRGWNANSRGWNANSRGWNANSRGWNSPVSSSDGQVIIWNLEDIFAGGEVYSLQALTTFAELPDWFTQVGEAYRFSAPQGLANSVISFQYLQRDIPNGFENNIQLYYSPDEGQTWEPLPTKLDPYRNLASAKVPGEGIYTLISAVAVGPWQEGWTIFGYPLQGTRSVTQALSSIKDDYSIIYQHQAHSDTPWTLYDPQVVVDYPTLAPYVNNLHELRFSQGYHIHLTKPTTLLLNTVSTEVGGRQRVTSLTPPATIFGWLDLDEQASPSLVTVTAFIDGAVCGRTNTFLVGRKRAFKLQVQAG
ncbi:MAG: hypothetical protein AAF485_21180, partial [Chloroflexota bacterium]